MSEHAPQRVERVPLVLAFEDRSAFKETYGGGLDQVVLEGQYLRPERPRGKTALLFMHPTGTMNLLPLPNALARAGVPVPHLRQSLSAQRHRPDHGEGARRSRRLRPPCAGASRLREGGPRRLERRRLPVALLSESGRAPGHPGNARGRSRGSRRSGLQSLPMACMQLAAHVSRATTLTEWLDPSILDETDPGPTRYGSISTPRRHRQPPYDEAFRRDASAPPRSLAIVASRPGCAIVWRRCVGPGTSTRNTASSCTAPWPTRAGSTRRGPERTDAGPLLHG
jgi:hypothetical protein